MSTSLWREAKAIVADALERPEEERAGFVERQCANSPALREEVESLLVAHARAGQFIEDEFLPRSLAGEAFGDEAPALVAGTEIGSYRLLRELGRGGMGAVYLAERADRTFEKHVAIKLVAGHVRPPKLIQRFLEERRILATLDHPNIAHILDAGATVDGLPYVVMEYVDGAAIDVHCQERRLPLRARLELFRRVCDAVHHAHQRLIVHQDIKSANILVASDGEPKLLDFGIAKLLEDGRGRSDTAVRAFTPESASPEQMRNEPVTVASDVYSLGALLYLLITGRKVFDFTTANDAEILETICERDPVPPSQATRSGPGQGERIARDLDWIALKALRKEPARRYASAAQLSDDCSRYLASEPVLAAPDRLGYRTSKFVRRHWVGVAAAAALIVTIGATSTAVWFEQQRAQRRFNDVRQLANTVVGELYDAIAEVPGSVAARQLLVTRALGYLDNLSSEAGNDTSLKIDLADAYQKIGDVQGNPYGANLGDVNGARASYQKLLTLRQAIHESERANRPAALALGRAHARLADLDLAGAKYAQAVESYERALVFFGDSPSDPQLDAALEDRARVKLRAGVALTWAGRRDEAKATLKEAIRLTQVLAGRPDAPRALRRGLAVSHANLGDVFHYAGEFEQALESHQRGVDLARQLMNEAPNESTPRRDVIMILARVGGDLVEMKRHAEAIRTTEESIALELELIKDDPANVQFQFDLAAMYGNLAVSQRQTRKLDAALQSIEQSIRIFEQAVARNPDFVADRFNFGGALAELGSIQRDRRATADAIRAFRRGIELLSSVPGDQRDPTMLLNARTGLGEALVEEASRSTSAVLWQEARVALQQALEGWREYQKATTTKGNHDDVVARIVTAIATVEKRLAR